MQIPVEQLLKTIKLPLNVLEKRTILHKTLFSEENSQWHNGT
jgi:hypothetical protein